MIDFYKGLVAALEAGQPFALGTVVSTIGSTPQKAGARAIFTPDGRITGTLGGGCLEMEARRRALQSLRSGEPELFDLQLDDDFGWDDGLICGGTACIFVNSVHHRSADAYRALFTWTERGEPVALATVVEAPAGHLIGKTVAVGAGCMEGDELPLELMKPLSTISEQILSSRASGPRVHTLEEAPGISLYIEPLFPRAVLLIVGGGHIGQALGHIAHLLDFEVHVLDDRPDFANATRFPEAASLMVDEIAEGVRKFPIHRSTFVVIVTRGHRHDGTALRECIHSPAAYIGMIGSRRKIHVIYEAILRDSLATQEELSRVHAPIGLDIGSKTVQEIAVSIAAQLVLVRSGGEANRQAVGMKRPRIAQPEVSATA